jgi:SNF2 family DNA or RNA helicase
VLRWLLDREQSPSTLADLFWTDLSRGSGKRPVFGLQLPAPNLGFRDQTTIHLARMSLDRPPVARGGILADEMGMGKTISALGLILANPPPAEWVAASAQRVKATLVVTPTTPLGQWEKEVKDKTNLRVVVAQEANDIDISQIRAADVVLCSYSTLARPCAIAETLRGLEYIRVIIDERQTMAGEEVYCTAISAPFRWCLTGTPLTDSVNSLVKQLSFLYLVPYALPHDYISNFIRLPLWSPQNSTADILAGMVRSATRHQSSPLYAPRPHADSPNTPPQLKRLAIRHTLSQERNGQLLVELPPKVEETVLVDWEDGLEYS